MEENLGSDESYHISEDDRLENSCVDEEEM